MPIGRKKFVHFISKSQNKHDNSAIWHYINAPVFGIISKGLQISTSNFKYVYYKLGTLCVSNFKLKHRIYIIKLEIRLLAVYIHTYD